MFILQIVCLQHFESFKVNEISVFPLFNRTQFDKQWFLFRFKQTLFDAKMKSTKIDDIFPLCMRVCVCFAVYIPVKYLATAVSAYSFN